MVLLAILLGAILWTLLAILEHFDKDGAHQLFWTFVGIAALLELMVHATDIFAVLLIVWTWFLGILSRIPFSSGLGITFVGIFIYQLITVIAKKGAKK